MIVGLNVGGAERALQRLVVQSSRRATFTHEVVSLTDVGVIGVELKSAGINVEALGMRSLLDLPVVLLRLLRYLRRGRPSLVQTWMYHADFIGGIAARLAGIDHIVWGIRTTEVKKGSSRATIILRKFCALLSFFIPKYVVCVAHAARESHVAVGYDESKMRVISNGLDVQNFSSVTHRKSFREGLGIPEDAVVVGSIGRFNKVKNHVGFIRSVSALMVGCPDLYVLMIGREVDLSNFDLKIAISETNYPHRFKLLGERKDIADCLSAMDIFCLHSLTEGFPNALAEAMAAGLPCVTTDVGDAGYLLGSCGVTVSPDNERELAAGLSRLLTMPELQRKALGLKSQQRVSDQFSLDKVVTLYEELYLELLASK